MISQEAAGGFIVPFNQFSFINRDQIPIADDKIATNYCMGHPHRLTKNSRGNWIMQCPGIVEAIKINVIRIAEVIHHMQVAPITKGSRNVR